MNVVWPEDFEVTLAAAKVAVAEPGADFPNFGPLSLFFENRILAHMVATTLIPIKGSLSSILTEMYSFCTPTEVPY